MSTHQKSPVSHHHNHMCTVPVWPESQVHATTGECCSTPAGGGASGSCRSAVGSSPRPGEISELSRLLMSERLFCRQGGRGRFPGLAVRVALGQKNTEWLWFCKNIMLPPCCFQNTPIFTHLKAPHSESHLEICQFKVWSDLWKCRERESAASLISDQPNSVTCSEPGEQTVNFCQHTAGSGVRTRHRTGSWKSSVRHSATNEHSKVPFDKY